MRATVSPAFPAVNGLITLIGLAGHFSALAATVAIERATAAKHADNVRIDIMFCTRKPVMPRSRGAAAILVPQRLKLRTTPRGAADCKQEHFFDRYQF